LSSLMRLSLLRAAHAIVSRVACRKSGSIGLFTRTLAASGGEFVELGRGRLFSDVPRTRLEQSLTDEAIRAGIERALFDQQRVVGDLSDAQKDAVPMQRAE
jgi:hypothetical protein